MKLYTAQEVIEKFTKNLSIHENLRLFHHKEVFRSQAENEFNPLKTEKYRPAFVEIGDAVATIFYSHAKSLAIRTNENIDSILERKAHISEFSLRDVERYLSGMLQNLSIDGVFSPEESNPQNAEHRYSKVPVYENRYIHFSIEGFVWSPGAEAQNHTHAFDCGAYVHQGSLVETNIGVYKNKAFPTKFAHLSAGNLSFRDPHTAEKSGKNGHNVRNPSEKQAVSFHIYAHDKAQSPHANKDIEIPWKKPYGEYHTSQVNDCANGWSIVTRKNKHSATISNKPAHGYDPHLQEFVTIGKHTKRLNEEDLSADKGI